MPLRDELLTPIPGTNPGGAELRYDPLYDKIKAGSPLDSALPPNLQGLWVDHGLRRISLPRSATPSSTPAAPHPRARSTSLLVRSGPDPAAVLERRRWARAAARPPRA